MWLNWEIWLKTEFGDLCDSLIRGRICGIPENTLREWLIRVDDLTLDKAITICRAADSTKEHIKETVPPSQDVHAVGSKHKLQEREKKGKGNVIDAKLNYVVVADTTTRMKSVQQSDNRAQSVND